MLKQVSIFRKRPDLTDGAFRDYWRNRHPEVVLGLPGIERYVQNHVRSVLAGDPACDGVAEVWFRDIETMRANAGTPALAAVRADEAHFLDAAGMVSIIAEEHVVVAGEPDDTSQKLIALIKRRPGLAPEAFRETWRNGLGGLMRQVTGVDRYVQAHCRPGIYRRREPEWDGMASVWFRSLPADGMGPVMACERTFLDTSRTVAVLVEEVSVR